MKFIFQLILTLVLILPQIAGAERARPHPPVECAQGTPNCVCVESGCSLIIAPLPLPIQSDILVGWYGSAGNAQYGFQRFNEDCNSPTANPSLHQVVETATFVNVIFEAGWGDWNSTQGRLDIADCIIQRLIEARAFGVKKAFITIDFLVYSNKAGPNNFTYRGATVVQPELRAFFVQLRAHGLADMVAAFYPIDEPGEYGLSDAIVTQANKDIRLVMEEFSELATVPLAVIYSGRSQPGLTSYDWIGLDDYNQGAGVLTNWYPYLLSLMTEKQKLILVPGAAFGQDPTPFYEYAMSEPKVAAILSFIWFDGWDGPTSRGARLSGTAQMYCEMGKKIIDPKTTYPDCTSPAPVASLTVNGQKRVTVRVGELLFYNWSSAHGKSFGSYWVSDNPSCSYGYLGAQWTATNALGGNSYPVMKEQVGCTYVITYTVCGAGAKCTADPIVITVKE